MNTDPLAGLLHSASRGCESDFSELYRKTRVSIYYNVLRVLKNASDSEDVLQDTYVTVWARAQQFDPCKGSAKGWINAIARNKALDMLRLKKRMPELLLEQVSETQQEAKELVCSAAQPQESIIKNELASALRLCLQQLPLKQRDCLESVFFEELSHSQVAARFGLPLGTVKTWVSRSYVSLKPMLRAHR